MMVKTLSVVKDNRTLEVSEKAFRVFYKEQGYKAVEDKPKRSTKKVETDES